MPYGPIMHCPQVEVLENNSIPGQKLRPFLSRGVGEGSFDKDSTLPGATMLWDEPVNDRIVGGRRI